MTSSLMYGIKKDAKVEKQTLSCGSQKQGDILVIDIAPAHLKIGKDLFDIDTPLTSQDLVRLNPFWERDPVFADVDSHS